jgi:hypothetical protein
MAKAHMFVSAATRSPKSRGKQIMRSSTRILLLGLMAALAWSTPAVLAAQDSPKQSIKDAGHDTKNAAKDTGKAVKGTAEKTRRAVKKGTNKVAEKTENGAAYAKDKTDPDKEKKD